MNSLNKQAMKAALSQRHIFKDCITIPFTSIALSNTNSAYFNICHAQKLRTFVGTGGNNYQQSRLKHMFYINDNNICGNLFGIPFRSSSEFNELVNSVPSEWCESVTVFKVELNIDNIHLQTKRTYSMLSKMLNIIFSKLINMEKLLLLSQNHLLRRIAVREFVDFDYKDMLLELLHTMQSNQITEIHLFYYGIKLTTHLFSNNMNEEKIKINFPILKQITFDINLRHDHDLYDNENYKECLNAMKNSLNTLLKPNGLLNYTHNSYEHLLTMIKINEFLGEKFKDNKLFFEISDFCNAVKFVEDGHCSQNNDLYVALYLDDPEVVNLLSSKEYQDKRKLDLSRQKLSLLENAPKLNVTELFIVSHFDLNLPNQKIIQLRESFCLFSPFLTSLIVRNINFSLNDIGEKLAFAYPNLKKFKLFLKAFKPTYDSYDNDFFTRFTKLEVLSLACIQSKEFEYPSSLRILELNCESYHETFSGPAIEKIKQLETIKPHLSYDINCFCCKPKQSFPSCSIKYNFNKSVNCVHYKMNKDLKLFYTVNMCPVWNKWSYL
uniref:FTH domain-containing protein n=1 Tax=Rhabditophanes sp. KR3021 TaxID=114890 RepID=A0AC35TJ22_9BILA